MPVSAESRFKTISMVLTADQVRRLEALRMLRSGTNREASKSEVIRDVIDRGLEEISRAPGSSLATNGPVEGAAA